MPTIRIPQEHWGKVWWALVEFGPIGRTSLEPIYHVSKGHVRMLRRKKLPFELLSDGNGRHTDNKHG